MPTMTGFSNLKVLTFNTSNASNQTLTTITKDSLVYCGLDSTGILDRSYIYTTTSGFTVDMIIWGRDVSFSGLNRPSISGTYGSAFVQENTTIKAAGILNKTVYLYVIELDNDEAG